MATLKSLAATLLVIALCPVISPSRAALLGRPQVQEDPTPKWYPRFSVSFNESTKILFRRETTGTWYYDAEQDAEVVERSDGNGDRYCGSIHPIQHTPCRHVVTGGKRYLIFPELETCCMCCTAEHGCGTLRQDWLADATFQGQEEKQGVPVYKWLMAGLQNNFYYSTADEKQLPVELDQMPNDLQSFALDTFTTDPIPPELLAIPSDCHAYCPISSICTFIRSGMVAGA